jgi:hypothetical protein
MIVSMSAKAVTGMKVKKQKRGYITFMTIGYKDADHRVIWFVCSGNDVNIKHMNKLVISLELQTIQLREHVRIWGQELGFAWSTGQGSQKVEHQNSGRETPAEWDTKMENIMVGMEKMMMMTVMEMGETIKETVVMAKTEIVKTEMVKMEIFEETAKEKVTEKMMAENRTEEIATAMEETETAMEEMDTETVKRTEEMGNIADSYQNNRNTHQTDGETILYML